MGISRRFERILLATDGSEGSRAAVDATIAIAKSPTAKVKVAQFWNLEVRHRHEQSDAEARGEAGNLVDATVNRLFRAGVIAEREICRADSTHVAAAIACAARVFEADLVVIGSRGLSDWKALTVHNDTNPLFHRLLSRFKALTGCPVLVNTSFNVRGEPIVCTPEDAFRCFMGSELDLLAIGHCVLRKEQQDQALKLDYSVAFEAD